MPGAASRFGLWAPGAMVSAASWHGVGDIDVMCGQNAGASTAIGVNNRAFYIPVVLTHSETVFQAWTFNGATAAGTTHIGVYDFAWKKVVDVNAAQSGTSTIQTFNIADTALAPGLYYLALMNTLSTATFRCTVPSIPILDAAGVRTETTGGTLPTTATPATPALAALPSFGMSLVATL